MAGPVILEREWELSELAGAARDAVAGDGGLVLILGEAGIGKSSLVHAVRGVLPAEGRLLVGRCDDLSTPRTLGPFRDLVGRVGTDLARGLREGDRDAVLAALRAELDWAGHPTVLAVEDVHWADALGAAPLARLVRAGLRELGVTHVPRGPVGVTRENPAGLTGRQVEVLRLLGEGFTNAEIADRLVISTRTVDSHVAAVLAKLGVATRRDAATRAADLGVLDAEAR